jgi:hypothetical protein
LFFLIDKLLGDDDKAKLIPDLLLLLFLKLKFKKLPLFVNTGFTYFDFIGLYRGFLKSVFFFPNWFNLFKA